MSQPIAYRARHIIPALTNAEAHDRAQALAGINRATRIKAVRIRPNLFAVTFQVKRTVRGKQPPGELSHAKCSKCSHELEDHYNGYCAIWGCPQC